MKYLLTFTRLKASVLLEYNEEKMLVKMTIEPGNFEHEHWLSLREKLPWHVDFVSKWRGIKNVILRKVEEDLSFDHFYKLYDQKFGKKSKSKAIWEHLPDAEKVKAIAYIPRYNQYLATGIAKKNPETYLNQQIWNN